MNQSEKQLLKNFIFFFSWMFIMAIIRTILPDIFPELKENRLLYFFSTVIINFIFGIIGYWIYYKTIIDKAEKSKYKRTFSITLIYLFVLMGIFGGTYYLTHMLEITGKILIIPYLLDSIIFIFICIGSYRIYKNRESLK